MCRGTSTTASTATPSLPDSTRNADTRPATPCAFASRVERTISSVCDCRAMRFSASPSGIDSSTKLATINPACHAVCLGLSEPPKPYNRATMVTDSAIASRLVMNRKAAPPAMSQLATAMP